MHDVTLKGFKNKKQALEFLRWYEGGGEQMFYDHLQIVDMSPEDGCNIDLGHKGNSKSYWDEIENQLIAYVK